MHGLKLWLLLPPSSAYVSTQHPAIHLASHFMRQGSKHNHDDGDGGDDGSFKIVLQKPGDVLYVPEHWAHAVLNLADSVAVSVEFHS